MLGLVDILVVIAKLPGQFMDNFFENYRVDVLTQHIQEEPVAHLSFLDDNIDTFFLDQTESYVEDVCLGRKVWFTLRDDRNKTIYLPEFEEKIQLILGTT